VKAAEAEETMPCNCYDGGGTLMWHINFCSGGIGSYECGKRVAAKHGTDRLIHLFTDTRSEDKDLYRFLYQSAHATGGILVHLADGRDLWQIFNDHRYIGNTRVDVCSKWLKRQVGDKWLKSTFSPENCTLYFGIDHSERHRFLGDGKKKPGIRARWLPSRVEAPLCDEPYMTKCEMLKACERDGIDPPAIYDEGFPHNNCGGFCVKAGHAAFLHLLKRRPETFAYHAAKEKEFQDRLGKPYATVLRDRRGGVTTPLPMYEFQRQVESGELKVNPRDWGKGCQCFTPDEEAEPE
jgi:hypothetical protein